MPDFHSLKTILERIFPAVEADVPLAKYTTIGIGGPARLLATATDYDQLVQGVRACLLNDAPFRVLGGGSNLIVSDAGCAGVIFINRADRWQILEAPVEFTTPRTGDARFQPSGTRFYNTEGLDTHGAECPAVCVRVESGARLTPLMKALFRVGVTGLQWFAGIPATVGGAVFMNMHGAARYFGDLVHSAELLRQGKVIRVGYDDLAFDYDYSILHKTRDILLSVDLILRKGDVEEARAAAREWARRKSIQPQKSAGCIFQNLSETQQARLNLPTPSIGYLIDKVLKLKGERAGDAIISPRHAAFIENMGYAASADVYDLVNLIKERAREALDLELAAEVEFLGEF